MRAADVSPTRPRSNSLGTDFTSNQSTLMSIPQAQLIDGRKTFIPLGKSHLILVEATANSA